MRPLTAFYASYRMRESDFNEDAARIRVDDVESILWRDHLNKSSRTLFKTQQFIAQELSNNDATLRVMQYAITCVTASHGILDRDHDSEAPGSKVRTRKSRRENANTPAQNNNAIALTGGEQYSPVTAMQGSVRSGEPNPPRQIRRVLPRSPQDVRRRALTPEIY